MTNHELQEKDVERVDKENTVKIGENKQSGSKFQKKKFNRIVKVTFLAGILVLAAGVSLLYMIVLKEF